MEAERVEEDSLVAFRARLSFEPLFDSHRLAVAQGGSDSDVAALVVHGDGSEPGYFLYLLRDALLPACSLAAAPELPGGQAHPRLGACADSPEQCALPDVILAAAFDRLRAGGFRKVLCVAECLGAMMLARHLETTDAARGLRVRFLGLSPLLVPWVAGPLPAQLRLAAAQLGPWLLPAVSLDAVRLPAQSACEAALCLLRLLGRRSFMGAPVPQVFSASAATQLIAVVMALMRWVEQVPICKAPSCEAYFFAFGSKDTLVATSAAVETAQRRWRGCETIVVEAGHDLLRCRDPGAQLQVDGLLQRAARFP